MNQSALYLFELKGSRVGHDEMLRACCCDFQFLIKLHSLFIFPFIIDFEFQSDVDLCYVHTAFHTHKLQLNSALVSSLKANYVNPFPPPDMVQVEIITHATFHISFFDVYVSFGFPLPLASLVDIATITVPNGALASFKTCYSSFIFDQNPRSHLTPALHAKYTLPFSDLF